MGTDRLHKFLFQGDDATGPAAVRGEIVSLGHAWRQMAEHHDYPAPVQRLLGEMVAASALLSANLKFDGALVMQIHGDGPVRLLVVECNTDLSMRATAKLAEGATIAAEAGFLDLVNPGGTGRCAITLDPADKTRGQQPYQGIVPLTGVSLAEAIDDYMLRSQQLDTRLWLAADARTSAGILLQRLPSDGGSATTEGAAALEARALAAAETWQRAVLLTDTIKREELLADTPETLMRKLFREETLRVFDALPLSFRCSCSRERVGRMLLSLGRTEIDEALAEQGTLLIHCDFCNRGYEFDAVDCAQLFAQGGVVKSGLSGSQSKH